MVFFGQNIFATSHFPTKNPSAGSSWKGGERGGLFWSDFRYVRLSRRKSQAQENGKYLIKGKVGKGFFAS